MAFISASSRPSWQGHALNACRCHGTVLMPPSRPLCCHSPPIPPAPGFQNARCELGEPSLLRQTLCLQALRKDLIPPPPPPPCASEVLRKSAWVWRPPFMHTAQGWSVQKCRGGCALSAPALWCLHARKCGFPESWPHSVWLNQTSRHGFD